MQTSEVLKSNVTTPGANGSALAPSPPPKDPPTYEPRSVVRRPSIHWYESWIVRSALMASFILLCGYVTSSFFTIKSIEAIAKLAHDQEIEATLGKHLEGIKRLRDLEQELAIERLKPNVSPWIAANHGRPPAPVLERWFKLAGLDSMASLSDIRISEGPAPKPGESLDNVVKWLDRDRLLLPGYVLEFPKGAIYESFKAAEDVRKRYQLVGVKLQEEIQPTLIKAHSVILLVSFLLLLSLFLVYAQRFKNRITAVIDGFSYWSEKDQNFRFDDSYRGELKLITKQFNAIATEVEANRLRSLYLEKIASWQIIARKLAHEIKNPLTPIQMMISQLKRRYKGEDEAFGKLLEEAQSIICEEVAGLRRMVDNFSEFARLPEPEPKQVDLVPMCRHVVELEKNAFPDHDIAFESPSKALTAVVDEALLRQVLLNLIKNAGEAAGDAKAKIRLTLEEATHDVILNVKDDGPGIPSELKQRIFEAYFTTKHTGPSPGMGLGLAVCQKIVMDHGGRMSVVSRPGETVFTIRLPKRPKAE